jgi:hypothetical protein
VTNLTTVLNWLLYTEQLEVGMVKANRLVLTSTISWRNYRRCNCWQNENSKYNLNILR